MDVRAVSIALVDLPSSGRPVSKETVAGLASSLREIGLINPITVIKATIYRSGQPREGYRLVCGRHRFDAACSLGWDEIEASVLASGEELHAELIEIDENLSRAELSAAQRAAAIKRRKEIWEAMHPNSGQTSASIPRGRGQPEQFASETAKASGQSKSSINQHIARAEALGPDIHAVVGTSLDKGVELDALKDMPSEKRSELIERARSGEQVSAREPANDDHQMILRLTRQAIGEIARLSGKASVDQVSQAMCEVSINPDLTPYIEAIYLAYRAAAKRAA